MGGKHCQSGSADWYHRELQLRRAHENNGAPRLVAVLAINRVQEDKGSKRSGRVCGAEPPAVMAVSCWCYLQQQLHLDDDIPGSSVEKLTADAATRVSVALFIRAPGRLVYGSPVLTKIKAHNLLAGSLHDAYHMIWCTTHIT